MSDRTLVARARAGDAKAFAELLSRHRARLTRSCAVVLGDACADVAQDAALVAWLQLDRLREPERFGAWLAGIGRVLSLRALRERRVESGSLPERAADEREQPLERVLARERAHELAAAIASLPPGQRDAVVQDVELPRPNAHALALSLLNAVGRSASTVRICRLEVGIFYAEVVLDDGTKVDARPSDALVLAVAAGLPIELDPAVLEAAAAGPPDEYTADLAESTVDAAQLADELRVHMNALAEEISRLAS